MSIDEQRPYFLSRHAIRPPAHGLDLKSTVPQHLKGGHYKPFTPIKRVGKRFKQDGDNGTNALMSFAGLSTVADIAPELEYQDFEVRRVIDRFDEGAALAFRHGEQYDSYQACETDYHQFWSSDRQGYISYAQSGKNILVRGGLIAPPHHQEELLEQFLDQTSRRGYRVAFFNMSDSLIPLFRKHSFQVSKWGEEPVIDLATCTFRGKQYEWVRRQTNYCIRNGLKAFEVRPEDLSPDVWEQMKNELKEVAADSISDKAQSGELRFFEGKLSIDTLGHRRLFIAKSEWGEGRIEGFVVCNPLQGGSSWSTEIYRHRRDSVRGTIAFLFQHIIERLRDEGRDRLHLCIVPGLRSQEEIPGGSRLVRYSFRFAGPWMSCLFDMDGLSHFKSRFRPGYENRYIFATPKVTIGLTMSFFNVLGIFKISPKNFSRVLYHRFVKCSQRKTLSKLT